MLVKIELTRYMVFKTCLNLIQPVVIDMNYNFEGKNPILAFVLLLSVSSSEARTSKDSLFVLFF